MNNEDIARKIVNQIIAYQVEKFFNRPAEKNNLTAPISIKVFKDYNENKNFSEEKGAIKLEEGLEIFFLSDKIDDDTVYIAVLDIRDRTIIYSRTIDIQTVTEDDIIEIGYDINDSINLYKMLFEVFSKKEVKSKKKKKK